MTARNLFDKVTTNWQVKILCFIAALVLYVGRTFSDLDKKTFIVPLDVMSTGAVSPTSKPPEFVRVTIRSTQANIADVLPSDLSATLDLTYLPNEGEFLVPVTVKLSPKVLMMDSFEVRMAPERVKMKVESKVVKYVEVKPSLVGESAHGYAVAAVTSEPDFVKISGPRTAVNAIENIPTEIVDVSDIMYTDDYEVTLQGINSLVTVSSPTVNCTVHVDVVPEALSRTFFAIPVKAVYLNKAFELSSEILPVTFDVEGTVPSLENFSLGENAVTVNCAEIKAPGTYTLPLRISLPYPLKVQNRSSETVKVTVRSKVVHNEKEGATEGAA